MGSTDVVFERFCDELGPSKVVHVYDPAVDLRGVMVIDNTACGPALGGVRMAPDVTAEEVFRLARAMTLKNAAAELPHGGGKSGIVADPAEADRPRLMHAFGRAIRELTGYIPAPDMGTDESCMARVQEETGRATGLPRVFGGIPLDEIGATGFGLAVCAEAAAPACGLDLRGATVAVEGFGNVGMRAARFLADRGATLVAASDIGGAVHDPEGIDVEGLIAERERSGSVAGYRGGRKLELPELLTVPCDILVPAARPDSIREDNAEAIRARLILQGANIPVTEGAARILHRRGIVSVPDFIANAGGVICAAVEYRGGSEREVFEQIEQKIRRNTERVLRRSRDGGTEPRRAAVELAEERVRTAMALRRPPER